MEIPPKEGSNTIHVEIHGELVLKLFGAMGREEECNKSYMFFLVVTLCNYLFVWEMLHASWSIRAILLTSGGIQCLALAYQALARKRLADEVSKVCAEALQRGAILEEEP